MNSLESFLQGSGMDETEALNKLQDAGVISDHCVWSEDVAKADCMAAVTFLLNEPVP